MAAKKGFEDFRPMFGEATAERDSGPVAAPSALPRPFLFYVHALDPCRLEIVATDFCSDTLERVLTVQDLEDLRDQTGVGSSCSEFVDYLTTSLSSDNVKLVLGGATRLVAHKSKGMPRISLFLNKLMGSSVNDVMGNLSLALYRAYKEKNGECVKEHLQCLQLERLLYLEKEKNECLDKELDSRTFKRKISRPKSSDRAVSVSDTLSNVATMVNSEAQQPSENPTGRDSPSMKASQRVVPAYRRAKVRGALLQDTEGNDS